MIYINARAMVIKISERVNFGFFMIIDFEIPILVPLTPIFGLIVQVSNR